MRSVLVQIVSVCSHSRPSHYRIIVSSYCSSYLSPNSRWSSDIPKPGLFLIFGLFYLPIPLFVSDLFVAVYRLSYWS